MNEAIYSFVDQTSNVSGKVGMWSRVAEGAIVGHSSDLGPWSKIGHYARIGSNVTFGQWASVGIDARIDAGSVLGSHEYVPSGMRRRRDGSLVRCGDFTENARIYGLFDAWINAIPSGAYTHEEYALREQHKAMMAEQLRELLPEFLSRRRMQTNLLWRPSFLQALLSVFGKKKSPAPVSALIGE